MNLVFDKKTLRVISVFDGNTYTQSEEQFLKSMFPLDFNNLSLWQFKQDIHLNPVHLRIQLDDDGSPESILFKGKVVYKSPKEEKQKYNDKIMEKKRNDLTQKLPKSLLRSITPDTIKLWANSPRTLPFVSKSLRSLDYFTDQKIMPVSWWGPFTDAGGYANMNRELVFRLHNYHIVPKVEICPTAPQVSQLAQYHLSKYTALDFSRIKKYPKVWAFTPLPHPPNPGKNIFFTMMESETLHPEFVRICNGYSDEVWVPSTHNQRVFRNSGVFRPIHVMPLGIDELLYGDATGELGVVPNPTPFVDLLGRTAGKGINKFKFLSLFGWSHRKGPDILIRSFVEEFDSNDDVALIIVARHSGSPGPEHINIIRREAASFAQMVRNSNYPQIVLYPHVIPEQQMPATYRMGHVFIQTSRGEGFSLPQIEAAACGLPVISCNNTGMSEYLNDTNAYLVKTNETEVCSPAMHWITTYYHGQLFPKLGRDQIDQTRRHMRFVREHYDQAKAKGEKLRELVFSKYTWRHASQRISNRIREIYREM